MIFDWITPLWTFIQDWRKRPSVGFTIATNTAWSAYTIQELLAAYGIRTWGWQIISGRIVFRLRAGQAAFAEHLMNKNGVPWTNSSDYKKHTRRHIRRKPCHSVVWKFFQRF